MVWDGSIDKVDTGASSLEKLSTVILYIQKNQEQSAELHKAKETFLSIQMKYKSCRESGDFNGFLSLEKYVQRFDCNIALGDQTQKFFMNQNHEIHKIAKAWRDMQDPDKVREFYADDVVHTGKMLGDVTVNRYINAQIGGLRRISSNGLVPDGYRELILERIDCWRSLQREHDRHIRQALERLID